MKRREVGQSRRNHGAKSKGLTRTSTHMGLVLIFWAFTTICSERNSSHTFLRVIVASPEPLRRNPALVSTATRSSEKLPSGSSRDGFTSSPATPSQTQHTPCSCNFPNCVGDKIGLVSMQVERWRVSVCKRGAEVQGMEWGCKAARKSRT